MKMKNIKKFAAILLAIMVTVVAASCLTACDDTDDSSGSTVKTSAEDDTIKMLKDGYPQDGTEITYGEAFEAFFANPTWNHFTGTRNGPDDDEDGEPDYVEENVDIVEFTGNCMYSNTEVKALIQFEISGDTFEAVFLSFNDVPQTEQMLNDVLEAAFEEAANGVDD